ncbi:hypothetical protein LCGC14_0717850 [marine sediment metagenome]|uniref:2TM domain-containing protein n=1 Tax=marine sediment metagenome TaxID=412755 RepID=A0A0F9SYM2_9ZZZZ
MKAKITWGNAWTIWMCCGMVVVLFDITPLRNWIFFVVYIIVNFGLLGMDRYTEEKRYKDRVKSEWQNARKGIFVERYNKGA